MLNSTYISGSGPSRIDRLPFLLPYVVYVLHTIEELQGFGTWATRHFGPETTDSFAGYHVPLMLLVLLVSWRAVATGSTGWIIAGTAFQWQFAVNAAFHLTGWIAFGEYAPGVVTGLVVSVPATAYYFGWIRRRGYLSPRQTALAVAIGTVIAALAIGFLFL